RIRSPAAARTNGGPACSRSSTTTDMSFETRSQHQLRDMLAGYRPPPGVPDELIDANGDLRPAWRSFLPHFAALGPEELSHRFARGDQYLRDAGVFFRQYGEGRSIERAWPLAHVPVLLGETEWRG